MNSDLDRSLGILARELGAAISRGRLAEGFDGQLVLIGSVVMALHGIDREVGDIDLFVTDRLAETLRSRGWVDVVHAPWGVPALELRAGPYLAHAEAASVAADIATPAFVHRELVYGWPAQPLAQLRERKRTTGRPKDVRDVELIDAALAAWA